MINLKDSSYTEEDVRRYQFSKAMLADFDEYNADIEYALKGMTACERENTENTIDFVVSYVSAGRETRLKIARAFINQLNQHKIVEPNEVETLASLFFSVGELELGNARMLAGQLAHAKSAFARSLSSFVIKNWDLLLWEKGIIEDEDDTESDSGENSAYVNAEGGAKTGAAIGVIVAGALLYTGTAPASVPASALVAVLGAAGTLVGGGLGYGANHFFHGNTPQQRAAAARIEVREYKKVRWGKAKRRKKVRKKYVVIVEGGNLYDDGFNDCLGPYGGDGFTMGQLDQSSVEPTYADAYMG